MKGVAAEKALGLVHKGKRPKAAFEKNVAGEVEEERFSLQRVLGLAAEGQTVALDMLFAPASTYSHANTEQTMPPAISTYAPNLSQL